MGLNVDFERAPEQDTAVRQGNDDGKPAGYSYMRCKQAAGYESIVLRHDDESRCASALLKNGV